MWPRLKNSPHTYAHEGLESIFLFEFIELQWVQTDFFTFIGQQYFLIVCAYCLFCKHLYEFLKNSVRITLFRIIC